MNWFIIDNSGNYTVRELTDEICLKSKTREFSRRVNDDGECKMSSSMNPSLSNGERLGTKVGSTRY